LIISKNKKDIRFREHDKDELAHYAKTAFDIEYKTSSGWKEWEGVHWRGDWDLSRHGEFSGNDFTYKSEDGKSFIPWVIETSGGVDRTFLFLLLDAYCEEEVKGEKRIVLKFKPSLSPIKAAILPLMKNKPENQGILDAMKAAGKRGSAPFWQKIALLNDIAVLAPMLGLLGTVTGMFYAFYDLNRSMESLSTLFDGLGISVGSTVAGLIVAILAMLFYTFLKFRLIRSMTSVENEAMQLAGTLFHDPR